MLVILFLEEQLFLLGCLPLYQAFTSFVEQPIGTQAL